MNDDYGVNESDSMGYREAIPVTNQKLEIMGLISMIVGIVGLPIAFCCSLFALPFPIASIILGIISFMKISKQPNEFKGKGFAIAGIILGVVVVLLAIGMFIVGLFLQSNNPNPYGNFNYNMSSSR